MSFITEITLSYQIRKILYDVLEDNNEDMNEMRGQIKLKSFFP